MIPPLSPNEETAVLGGVIYALMLVLLCSLLERGVPDSWVAETAKAAIEAPQPIDRALN